MTWEVIAGLREQTNCDDPDCIYGHRCPAPERKDGKISSYAAAEGKNCIFGTDCRFPSEMHDHD